MPEIRGRAALPALLLAALAACDGSAPAEPEPTMTQPDAVALAQTVDLSTSDALAWDLGRWLPGVSGRGNAEFTVTRECPKGGSVTIQGKRTVAIDQTTRTGTITETATRTDKACAHAVRNGVVITQTGDPNVVVGSVVTVTAGTPGVRTSTHKGAYKWSASDGRSGRCVMDFTATFDPATKTHTVKGTVCNQTVDRTTQRG